MLAPSGGGGQPPRQCLAIIQSDFQTDSRMRAKLASDRACVWHCGRGKGSRKWWRETGKGREGEVEAANEGRKMTVIQPLLHYNLKQCVMELSSSPSVSLSPLPFLALRCPPPPPPPPPRRPARKQSCLRDRQLYPSRIEEATAAAVSAKLCFQFRRIIWQVGDKGGGMERGRQGSRETSRNCLHRP